MAILDLFKEAMDSGDPIVRSWPLVDTDWIPIMSSLLYIFFVKRLGPALMRNRKPFDLRLLMIVYNFSIVFVYTVCLLTIIYASFPVLLSSTSTFRFLCSPVVVKENDFTYTCTAAGWYLYILKYVEFADTIFFILRKKNHLVTNLHVIHHAALPLIVWFIMRTENSGFQFIPGGINSFIHIIMYTYYGLAAMGPEVQKKLWWKEYLTRLQMVQFVVILLFMFVALPLSGCKTSMHGVYIIGFFALLFLALFYNFYSKTYKAKHKLQSNGVHHKANGTSVKRKESNGTTNVKESNGTAAYVKESNGVAYGSESNGLVKRKESSLSLLKAFNECHF